MEKKKKKKRKPKKKREKKERIKKEEVKYKYCISTIATGLDCLSEQVHCVKVSFECIPEHLQQVLEH